jgi:peptide/nickel transport system ATP-binding protein
VSGPVLELEGLTVAYGGHGAPPALRDVDLRVPAGSAYGLVGESGSGKSTLALAALRYLSGAGRIVGGRVLLGGDDLWALPPAALRDVWSRRVRLVPQDPLASLNPSLTVGRQVAEGLANGAGTAGAGIAGAGTAGAGTAGPPAPGAPAPPLASPRSSPAWASPTPTGSPPATRTSSRAGCSSGSRSPWPWAARPSSW